MTANATGLDRSSWLSRLCEHLPQPSTHRSGQRRHNLATATLPSPRLEHWRFTDLASLRHLDLAALHQRTSLSGLPGAGPGALRLSLDAAGGWVDGKGRPVAWPAGLEPMAAAEIEAALGRAAERCAQHQRDARRLGQELNDISAGPVLGLKVRGAGLPALELVLQPAAAHAWLAPRVLLQLEANSRLELLWSLRCNSTAVLLPTLEAELGEGASLHEALLAQGHGTASLFATSAILQGRHSDYRRTGVVWGWGLSREEPRVVQLQGAAGTSLRGLAVARDDSLLDTHSLVRFEGPDGRLDQCHQALADNAGRSVFNGSVQVPRPAQGTDAAQLSRNLLLSDHARIDTKPELEIVADDVKCTHGATISRLRDDELFYLQSRGISRHQAARLLQRGFFDAVVRQLPAVAAPWSPLQALLGASEVRP